MEKPEEYPLAAEHALMQLDQAAVLDRNGRLRREYMAVSDSFGWTALAVQWGSLFALLTALPLAWALISPAASLVLVPFLGLAAYRLTFLMHDCAHNTLFSNRRANSLVGRYTGWMIGSDFEEFRRLHWEHHRRFGKMDDPQGRDYLGLTHASRRQMIWHLLRPLFGFNLFKIGGFIPKPVAGSSPGSLRKRLVFLAGVGGTQLAFAAVASGFGQYPIPIFFYPAAAATFGLFLSQTRGFCEHVPPAGRSTEEFLRTHEPNWFDRTFFYAINFNYHVEHHLFPSAPACRLPMLHSKLKPQLSGADLVSPSILSTIGRRLEQCSQ